MDAEVAQVALDRVVAKIAVTPVQLEGLVAHLEPGIRREPRLAMAQRSVASASPASSAAAARHTISRADSSAVAMSASLNWVTWKSAMARPNCRRSPTYSRAAS